jgi:hypothetical protein
MISVLQQKLVNRKKNLGSAEVPGVGGLRYDGH